MSSQRTRRPSKTSSGSCGRLFRAAGEASICTADFIEGLTDEQIEAIFQTARNADYAQIAEEARSVLDSVPSIAAAITDEDRTGIEANLSRLKKRFSSVTALDFFAAPGREPAETVMRTTGGPAERSSQED